MQTETRQCQSCHKEFSIEPEDFLFYQKIKVPPPTWCPKCRLERRLAHITFANFYKRKCDLCKEEFISVYSLDKPYTVYCNSCWWSDKWNSLDYGLELDFSKPFFEQLQELLHRVPLLGIHSDYPMYSVNAAYNNLAGSMKDCYMLIEADTVENCAYGHFVIRMKDCYDVVFAGLCEYSYDLFHNYKVFHGIGCKYTTFSNDCMFLWQSANCQDCFGSANLRNKQYVFFNQQYSKDEYQKKIKEYDLGSFKDYERASGEARRQWLKYPVKTFWDEFSKDTSGLFVFFSKNCRDCFEVSGVEDSRYTTFIEQPSARDAYDYSGFGHNAELIYETAMIGRDIADIKMSHSGGFDLRNIQYSILCVTGVADVFGCVSLRKKSHCILNKQYSKEEYEKLVLRIIKHMSDIPFVDGKGRVYRYGEFFPHELTTIAYNESFIHPYTQLTKDEALARGFSWKDEEKKDYAVTMQANDLPDHIRDAEDSLLKEVIACAQCNRGYRLIPAEIQFYRKINVPLPRLCPFCRIFGKIKEKPNPFRMQTRKCQCTGQGSENGVYGNVAKHFHGFSHCPNEFETSYAPDRPEIVYCKECYQKEFV